MTRAIRPPPGGRAAGGCLIAPGTTGSSLPGSSVGDAVTSRAPGSGGPLTPGSGLPAHPLTRSTAANPLSFTQPGIGAAAGRLSTETTRNTSGSLTVQVPDAPSLLPSGWYMALAADRKGVPSKDAWLHARPTA